MHLIFVPLGPVLKPVPNQGLQQEGMSGIVISEWGIMLMVIGQHFIVGSGQQQPR